MNLLANSIQYMNAKTNHKSSKTMPAIIRFLLSSILICPHSIEKYHGQSIQFGLSCDCVALLIHSYIFNAFLCDILCLNWFFWNEPIDMEYSIELIFKNFLWRNRKQINQLIYWSLVYSISLEFQQENCIPVLQKKCSWFISIFNTQMHIKRYIRSAIICELVCENEIFSCSFRSTINYYYCYCASPIE